jgi:hypothetical protein
VPAQIPIMAAIFMCEHRVRVYRVCLHRRTRVSRNCVSTPGSRRLPRRDSAETGPTVTKSVEPRWEAVCEERVERCSTGRARVPVPTQADWAAWDGCPTWFFVRYATG